MFIGASHWQSFVYVCLKNNREGMRATALLVPIVTPCVCMKCLSLNLK